MDSQSHTEVVRASIDTCFDTITDFARYPDWFLAITEAEITEHDPDACVWEVRFSLNMVIKTIGYTLRYEGVRPNKLSWHMVDGDVNDVRGTYDFTELEPGVTEAVCSQSVDVGFWIPGPIKRSFEASALKDSVGEFKAAAEASA